MDGTTLTEAHETVSDAIATVVANANETADEAFERGIAVAEAQLSEAERAAAAIANSAIIAEWSNRFEEFKRELREWLERVQIQVTELQPLQAKVEEMTGQIAALALSSVPTNPSLSIQPTSSEVQEAAETVSTALPMSLSESVVVESPVPQTRKVKRRFL